MTTAIDEAYAALCSGLDSELERQENVLAVCRALGAAARKHDVQTVDARTHALALLIEETVAYEPARMALFRRIVEFHALTVERQTLSHLIAISPQPWRRRLAEFQSRMQSTLIETQRAVSENQGMLRRSLRVLGGVVRQATGGDSPAAYDAHGKTSANMCGATMMVDASG